MRTMTVALLGAGRMGRIHFTNLQRLPKVNVKYVYDPTLVEARDTVSDENLQKALTGDINKILNDNDVCACIIATPSAFHAELIMLCAAHKKHVFCEKPVSFDINCLLDIKSAVASSGITLQVGFNRRFDRSVQHIYEAVRVGAAGRINVVKITNRDPERPRLHFVKNSGGLFFDFNIHDFDMLRFITSEPVAEVYAMGGALIQQELKQYNDIDTAIISVKMASGILGIIDASRETGYGYDQQLEVFGDAGMLHMVNQMPTTVGLQNQLGGKHDRMHESFVERYRESYANQINDFFSCIDQQRDPSVTIDDALAAVRVAYAAQRSLTENRPVAVSY